MEGKLNPVGNITGTLSGVSGIGLDRTLTDPNRAAPADLVGEIRDSMGNQSSDFVKIADVTIDTDTNKTYSISIPAMKHVKVTAYNPNGSLFSNSGYFFTDKDWEQGIFVGGNTLAIAFAEFDCDMHIMRCTASTAAQAEGIVRAKFLQRDAINKVFMTPNGGNTKAGTRIIVYGK